MENIQIGNKVIPISKAMKYYKNQVKCQKKLSLTSDEYCELIDKLLKHLKQHKNTVPQPNITTIPTGINSKSNLGYLNQFDHKILPNTYQATPTAPSMGPTSLPNSYENMHHGVPNNSADQIEGFFGNMTTQRQDANISQHLMNRRFSDLTSNSSLIMPPRPGQPFDRLHNNITSQIPGLPVNFSSNISQQDRWQQAFQDQLGNNQICSRTFDLAQETAPAINIERQGMTCRRGGTRLF